MAANKELKRGVKQLGKTIGKTDKLTSGLIKAATASTKKTTKQDNQKKPGAPKVASYKEYLDMSPTEVSKLKKEELRGVVARLNKIESKRLKNLEKYGYNTAAVRGITDTGGKTKASTDMTRQELLHEYKRAKSFLQSETSTVAGAKRFVKGIQEMVGADRPLTSEEVSRMYDILDKYKESGAIGFYKKGDKKSAGYVTSQATQRDIYEMMQAGKSDDEILVDLGVMSRSDYEAMQDTSTDFNWM